MRTPRVSIASLMFCVGLSAVGVAALKNPTELWSSCWFSATVGTLLFAFLGVLYRQGKERQFWVGFSVFGWAYFLMGLANGSFHVPLLPTTLLMNRFAPNTFLFLPKLPLPLTTDGISTTSNYSLRFPSFIIGQSMATLFVALLGSQLARVFVNPGVPTE